MKFSLLTEAGAGIGFGHLTRMMALASALKAAGAQVAVLVHWSSAPEEIILDPEVPIFSFPWRHSETPLVSQDSTAIIDSYLLPIDGYAKLRAVARTLVAIDDFERLPYPADLVVNPNAYGTTVTPAAIGTRRMGGAEFVLVRRPFACAAGSFVVRETMGPIGVTLGGSDTGLQGQRLASTLAREGFDVVLFGPRRCTGSYGFPVTTTSNAGDLVSRLLEVDLVVCGGGQTLHELACLGVPACALEVSPDQASNVEFYERAGCIVRVSDAMRDDVSGVAEAVHQAGSFASRSRMSAIGKLLIDGRGADRLAIALMSS